VLRGIVALAGALDLAVIAEGVETKPSAMPWCARGAPSWQGFLGGETDAGGRLRRSLGGQPCPPSRDRAQPLGQLEQAVEPALRIAPGALITSFMSGRSLAVPSSRST
jgi:EAL domain-containing protein (putative c-di-GMP-specific phosphodiesterase class I)